MPTFFITNARGGREGKIVRAGVSARETLRALGVTRPVQVQRKHGNVWVHVDAGYMIREPDTLRAVPLGAPVGSATGTRFAAWLTSLVSKLRRKKK